MDFITNLTPEEIKKAGVKSYHVTICDDACNSLVLKFVEFGFKVII